FTQADVKINGWAVENRVYAEDPYRGFLPSIGRLVRYNPPRSRGGGAGGDGGGGPQEARSRITPSTTPLRDAVPLPVNGEDSVVRVDDGVTEGGEVSMFYDPMIAKLITWAPTREEAIDAQIAALDAFEIEGPGNNIDFLSALMQHPRFRSGAITTGFIAEEYPDGFHGAPASPDLLGTLAAIAAFAATAEADRARRIDGQLGKRLRPPSAWVVRIDGADHDVTIATDGVTVDGADLEITLEYTPGDRIVTAELADEDVTVRIARTGTGFRLTTRGASHVARVLPAHVAPYARHLIEKVPPDLSKFLIAPMPGLLVRLDVAVGDAVQPGQALAVVEAMKMENILRAEKAGVVKSVSAEAGASLSVDEIILEME
ncbi:MAG: acetyl/propionyl-CoA carboxylase subunit alpha, partial [Pseudomonadota bacterium]|nr:acetyl/propionyl-CoA carboxylase subunit alpha [Pseudomonadota bacterium]